MDHRTAAVFFFGVFVEFSMFAFIIIIIIFSTIFSISALCVFYGISSYF